MTKPERAVKAMWIRSLGRNLTGEQKQQIREVAVEETLAACQQDSSYLRCLVTDYLDGKSLLRQACEIAGGERDMTTEILGFDVVTGKETP